VAKLCRSVCTDTGICIRAIVAASRHAQDDRQPLTALGACRLAEAIDLERENCAREQQQCALRLVLRAGRHVAVYGEVREEVTNPGGHHLRARTVLRCGIVDAPISANDRARRLSGAFGSGETTSHTPRVQYRLPRATTNYSEWMANMEAIRIVRH